MTKSKLISVILPVYNAEKYIAEALTSVLTQSYKNFELILINDLSTDNSIEKIKNFNDERLRIINNKVNLGIARSLNIGINHAKGDYIAIMHADDISLPERLTEQYNLLENNNSISIIGSSIELIGHGQGIRNYPTKDSELRAMLIFDSPFCHPSVMFSSKLLKELNIRYREDDLFLGVEDYDLWTRIPLAYSLSTTRSILLKYRLHPNQMSQKASILETNSDRIRHTELNKIGIFPTNQELILHCLASRQSFDISFSFLTELEKWLIKLTRQNHINKKIEPSSLEKVIEEVWWNSCNRSSSLGEKILDIYINSSISKMSERSSTEKAYLLSKCRSKS